MEATATVQDLYTVETECRSCGSGAVTSVIKFGDTPLADRLLTEVSLHKPEPIVPLTLGFCPDCGLAQIRETVDPEVLFFDECPYFSSVSPSLLEHFRESALNLIETRDLDAESFVLEAGSNDGYMLRNFAERDIPVLGIDPAEEPARTAREKGIETRCTFFTKQRARELRAEGIQADLFLANNVLAHVSDLNGFVEGIRIALKSDGMAVIEVPYVVDLVDHGAFDTIYHQHLCYFSVTALDRLFRRHDLYLNDVERTSIHGGSLRLYVEPREHVPSSVRTLLGMERGRDVDQVEFYRSFGDRVARIRSNLRRTIDRLRAAGNRIVDTGPPPRPPRRSTTATLRRTLRRTTSTTSSTSTRTSTGGMWGEATSRSPRRSGSSRTSPTTRSSWPGTSPTRFWSSSPNLRVAGGRSSFPSPTSKS